MSGRVKGTEVICINEKGFWYEPYPKIGDILKVLDTRMYQDELWLKLDGYDYCIFGSGKVGFVYRNFMKLSQYSKL